MGIFMPTLSCLVAPPCTPVLLIVCKRRSLLWLHPPLRSRSLLLPRGSTPSGSVAPSCLPSPPSNRCGSPSKNTMNAVHPLFTGNASKYIHSVQSLPIQKKKKKKKKKYSALIPLFPC